VNEPIAIVGMACRLPGADGLAEFWDLLVTGRAAWGPLPESRLPRDLYFDPEKGRRGKSYSELGAVVSDRPVDPGNCPLTADMAARYDIAHQIFLEVASLACRDAGMNPFAMPAGRRTGVYVGHTGGSTRISDIVYATGIDEAVSLLADVDAARRVLGDALEEVVADVTDAVRRRYPGRQPGQRLDLGAIGAAKIVQEALRLDGPYLVVDAACASSLQALAIAARSLAQGGIDQAIVGGASFCKSDSLVLFSAAQSVSNTGSCPFAATADGLVTAEGSVAIVLKTLSRAIADNDRIRGVIRGLGVSSDGKGKSLWAPRHEGQILAVQRAYPDPADLGLLEYIEAHATSTQVGDATELAALSGLLRPRVAADRKIPLGSVKANIGHTLETAGLASLVKVLLALEHDTIPPGSRGTDLNGDFDWQAGPFTVPSRSISWPPHGDGSPRLAAVNAFGIGGLNVHVAVAEHVPTAPPRPPARAAADPAAIAIIGAGCVLPGSLSLDAFLTRLERQESAVGPVPAERWRADRGPRTWHTLSARGGFVRGFVYDWRRHRVPPKQIEAANPLQFMLLEAADAALTDAGGLSAGLDRSRTAVVVGTLFGGDFANELQMGLRLPETARYLRAALARHGITPTAIDRIVDAYEQRLLQRMPALLDETGSFTSSTLASRLTKTFDLAGGALALDAGDCSSIAAIAAAVDMLREGVCDAVLCAAGQRSLDLVAFEGLSLRSDVEGARAQDPDSCAPGEGAVVFVLRRLHDAEAAGQRIRGVIRDAEVRTASPSRHSPAPPLARLIGHTGAAAAAAELLPLIGNGHAGSVTISDGGLAARIEFEPPPAAASPRPAATRHSAAARPLVAAIFPGQGSQYTDMFRGLATESDTGRAAVARLDAMARAAGHQTLAELAWRPDNGLGTRIWDTQWGMFLGDLLAWETLRGMGFTPDVVASHSFGEFPALVAAGGWSVADGAQAAWARAEAVEAHGPRDGAMLSVIADRATVQGAIELFPGQVWICAENSPEQCVIGGTARVVDAVEVLLETRRVRSKRLAVPSPFHTPLLGRAAEQLAMTIQALPIAAPRLPIYSSTLARPLTTPDDVRESLIRQMTETVRWIDVVEAMYAAGVRTFVEVGPAGVLTGLTRRILQGREGVSCLQFDQRGRAADQHLSRLHDCLREAGAIRRDTADAPTGGPSPPGARRSHRGTVVAFDATARRRARNRGGAVERSADVTATASAPAVTAGRSTTPSTGVSARHGRGTAVATRPAATTTTMPEPPRRQARDDREPSRAAAEIEAFLIDFVIEQTGYPREIVEFDADLEAELGIDSIRRAQLFGEIGQKYGLQADDGVSLDAFPTLRHLRDYLLPRIGGGTAVAAAHHRPAATTSATPTAATSTNDPEHVPAGACDGFHVLVVSPRGTSVPRGIAACFGRHTVPTVRRTRTAGIAATVVTTAGGPGAAGGGPGAAGGAPGAAGGSPGAVAGWNDAGLLAVACPQDTARSRGVDGVEPLITSCRSLDDARRFVAGLRQPPVGLAVLDVAGGGFHVVPDGGMTPLPEAFTACDPRSPLARVALADGAVAPQTVLTALLSPDDSAARDALSATCGWFACGIGAAGPGVVSGGPVAGVWLADDADATSAAWLTTAASPGASRHDDGSDAREVTRRYALALRDAGPVRRVRSLARERVLILGPSADTEPLVHAVTAQGGVAIVADCRSAEDAITAVEQAEQAAAVRHLIVAAPSHPDPWMAHRGAGIVAPFIACQRWILLRGRAGDLASSTLTAAIDLGGDFGLSGTIEAVAGGGLSGLFKGIAREFPAVHVRVVDAAAGRSPAAATAVIAELLDGPGPVEIALVQGRRMTVMPEHRPPQATTPLGALARGSVWIVTGGARGVTAECARELGRRHGLVLALVGSTEPVAIDPAWPTLDEAGVKALRHHVQHDARDRGADPRSTWRTIEKSIEIARSLARMRAAGVDARYIACDLADETAARTLVRQVVRDLGPVRGMLHGAGYESACRFEKKTIDGLESTLGPKCLGLEHLLAAVDPHTLETVVGFGSTSGRFGGHGQADYSLANEMLAKLVAGLRQRRPSLRCTVFHWHAWDEVGMASRPESRFVLEQFGLTFMPLAEGLRRFMAEIEAGLPDAEVLVTEPACVPDDAAVPAVECESPASHHASAGRGSLVDTVVAGAGSTQVLFHLDPTSDSFLLDHLRFGRPLLPAVMGAELLAQAAVAAGACTAVREIRDFVVEHPLAFPTDQPRRIRVDVMTQAAGVQAVARTDPDPAGTPAAATDQVHLRAALLGAADPIVAAVSQPPLPFNPMVYDENAPLWHGRSLRTLSGLFLDRHGGWGRLLAPAADVVAAPRGAAGWTVPIALLDGCLVACAVYSYILCGQRVEVPVRFDRLRIAANARTGEPCTLRLVFQGSDPRESRYDLVLFGDDGRPLLALDGLHLAVTAAARRDRP